jgi:apolipoprotein N-acyltransferase
MTIDWLSFASVVGVALVAACALVALFSLALRIADGDQSWRRPVAVTLFVLCGLLVAFGIYLIVPALHFGS